MPADFDRCVKQVMKQGRSKDSAFAICTATFKKAGKSTENMNQEKQKEKRFDEEGRVIISENTKFYIGASINTIKE